MPCSSGFHREPQVGRGCKQGSWWKTGNSEDKRKAEVRQLPSISSRVTFLQRVFCYTIESLCYNSGHRELRREGFTVRHYNHTAYSIIQAMELSVNSPNFFTAAYSACKRTQSRLTSHIPAFRGLRTHDPTSGLRWTQRRRHRFRQGTLPIWGARHSWVTKSTPVQTWPFR